MDLRTKHTELVRRAIKQDEAAFEQLILLHNEQLYRTAYVYVKNEQDALDVVQETVYKAFISIGQVKEPKYFVTWLTKILIRNCYRVLNQQTAVADLIEQIPVKESSREEHLDLIDALSHLRKEYRDVLVLFYFHDVPMKEIASFIGITLNTVKTYLRRGREELKKQLGGLDYVEARSSKGV
ncbi:RNA polymerase, sigma-24 subunit, ECF subfamily [Exiguobacterium sibiricum 255-15]|uniref:RNA polymerase, sigma-24 subunit, ECF subfamily n=1 Tax=Exiguobacterium sibiricum (strain DSM 17290 / CCUG 55495 / CIP 109462 / JCM 13490 / 255-15) TaxID=262543 RepID=B1YHB9_EXIS2|nr:sigma-70 family RNA polymerase sigma factor [Exiguobacterium sibiricum]ACB59651.1 RNA polymerase, sigma-24 subunit, ECF subfamily [Exiguobacterium sibiricum 255-15]